MDTILKEELSKLGFRTISTIANIFYYIISWILVAVLTITILKIMKCLQNKCEFLHQKLCNNLNDIKKTFIKIQIQYTYLGFLLIWVSHVSTKSTTSEAQVSAGLLYSLELSCYYV